MMTDTTGAFDEIPDEIVKSVLGQAGFDDTAAEITTPEPEEVHQETEEEPPHTPPSAPGGPLFHDEDEGEEQEEEGIITFSDGSKYPLAMVEEWKNRANTPIPEPITSAPPQQQQPYFQLPAVTPEDLEMAGPAVQALLYIANAQQQQLKQLRDDITSAKTIQEQNAETESAKVLNAARSNFQAKYNLPDDLMAKIEAKAESDDVTRHLRQSKDPYAAVDYALERSYWNLPEARQYEFARQHDNRVATQARKQKLAGVSGGAGPSSRGVPPHDETTQEGRHAAAVDFVRQAMYGDE